MFGKILGTIKNLSKTAIHKANNAFRTVKTLWNKLDGYPVIKNIIDEVIDSTEPSRVIKKAINYIGSAVDTLDKNLSNHDKFGLNVGVKLKDLNRKK